AARAAKEVLLESAESDLQLRRYKEREKVEKNSKIGDNLTFLRELEKMCQYSMNPLEKIGLRLKEEYYYGNKVFENIVVPGTFTLEYRAFEFSSKHLNAN
nr:DNA-binding bromodomain-containing protein [Tanacetum cinerariifolium]